MSIRALVILVTAFVLWHAALWSIACWFLARTAGWKRLATRFPDARDHRNDARAGGMLMIGEKWNGSVRVSASADGLAVAPAPLMRVAHPRFVLPWRTLTALPPTHSPVIRSTHIAVDGEPLAFYGAAADLVMSSLARYAPATRTPISSNA